MTEADPPRFVACATGEWLAWGKAVELAVREGKPLPKPPRPPRKARKARTGRTDAGMARG
jgi:hypothetical protein